MTEKRDHNNIYTAQDIERYHSGKMSPQEMHLLEKAALDDPFLADALEGYHYAQRPVDDMEELKTSLQNRLQREKKKVAPIYQRKDFQWMKIAAMFLLIAGAGWLIYRLSFTPLSDNVAGTAKQTTKDAETADISSNREEKDLIRKEAKDSGMTDRMEEVSTATTTSEEIGKSSKRNNDPAKRKANNEGGSPANNEEPVVGNLFTLKDSEAAKEQAYSKADTAQVSTIDSANAAMAAAASKETVTPGKDNVIVMRRAKNSIPEVVLSKNKVDSASRKPNIVFEEAVPVKGEIYYNDYLAENLKLPEGADLKTQPGVVQLSFDVNDVGEPVNIKVEKSLCEACDKEAIRILKQGPRLVKKKKNKKGKVSIRF